MPESCDGSPGQRTSEIISACSRGSQIPNAVAGGQDGRRLVDLVTRGEQVQSRALSLGGGLQGFGDVVGQRDRFAVVAVGFPGEHRLVQRRPAPVGFIRQPQDGA